jgi:hypothetical protein
MQTADFEIAGKPIPLRFGLAASEKKVISLATFQQGFPNRNSRSSGEIGFGPVLSDLAALLEEKINLLPSPLFWGHGWAKTASSVTEKTPWTVGNRRFGGRNLIWIFKEW